MNDECLFTVHHDRTFSSFHTQTISNGLMLMMLLRMRCVQQQTRLRGERGQGLLQSCWLLLLLL